MDAQKKVHQLLEQNNFVLARSNAHNVWIDHRGRTWVTGSTPSDINAWLNNLSDLRNFLAGRSISSLPTRIVLTPAEQAAADRLLRKPIGQRSGIASGGHKKCRFRSGVPYVPPKKVVELTAEEKAASIAASEAARKKEAELKDERQYERFLIHGLTDNISNFLKPWQDELDRRVKVMPQHFDGLYEEWNAIGRQRLPMVNDYEKDSLRMNFSEIAEDVIKAANSDKGRRTIKNLFDARFKNWIRNCVEAMLEQDRNLLTRERHKAQEIAKKNAVRFSECPEHMIADVAYETFAGKVSEELLPTILKVVHVWAADEFGGDQPQVVEFTHPLFGSSSFERRKKEADAQVSEVEVAKAA